MSGEALIIGAFFAGLIVGAVQRALALVTGKG